MNTQKMYELKEMLCRELEGIANKGDLSANDLAAVKMLTSSMDHICNVMEKEEDGGSSMRGGSYGHYVRGHYSREGTGQASGGSYDGGSYRYSRDGYSRNGDVVENLRRMMNEASDPKERDAIRRCIESMR